MGTRLIDHGKSVLLALLPLPTQGTRSYKMVFKILKHSHSHSHNVPWLWDRVMKIWTMNIPRLCGTLYTCIYYVVFT